nr:MAG TPA: hypothetical protein [Caudoviricetes sp.]
MMLPVTAGLIWYCCFVVKHPSLKVSDQYRYAEQPEVVFGLLF